MCRSIKTLHNFEPPATEEEIRASSLQFVRKLSGFSRPSRANEAAFTRAVDDVARVARTLLDALVTNAPPRDREVEASKARARGMSRRIRRSTSASWGSALKPRASSCVASRPPRAVLAASISSSASTPRRLRCGGRP
jgi:hypothetical protein